MIVRVEPELQSSKVNDFYCVSCYVLIVSSSQAPSDGFLRFPNRVRTSHKAKNANVSLHHTLRRASYLRSGAKVCPAIPDRKGVANVTNALHRQATFANHQLVRSRAREALHEARAWPWNHRRGTVRPTVDTIVNVIGVVVESARSKAREYVPWNFACNPISTHTHTHKSASVDQNRTR